MSLALPTILPELPDRRSMQSSDENESNGLRFRSGMLSRNYSEKKWTKSFQKPVNSSRKAVAKGNQSHRNFPLLLSDSHYQSSRVINNPEAVNSLLEITPEEVKETGNSLQQVRDIREEYKSKVRYLERTEEKVIAKMSARTKASQEKIEK